MAHSKLKSIRLANGLTQKQTAEKLFTNQSSISKYENNHKKMDERFIHKAAEEFGADPNELKAENFGSNIFESGSTNVGTAVIAQNYYHVPKELLDSMILQQATSNQQLTALTNLVQVQTALVQQLIEKMK